MAHDIETLITSFERALLSLDRLAAKDTLRKVMATHSGSEDHGNNKIEDIVTTVLERIGRGWENGGIALSQVYMSGRICEELLDDMPMPPAFQKETLRKTAVVVLEDYHMLGKRMVCSVLRASGFIFLDFGRMDIEALFQKVRETKVDILLISTLMLPSALKIRTLKDRLLAEDITAKIVVGGAPFRLDKELWKDVGADAMGTCASDSVAILKNLIGKDGDE